MSYCRWSSMDGKCDVYAYESDRGFEILTAKYKLIDNPEFEPDGPFSAEWLVWYERNCKPRGLPYDGQEFLEHTLEDFKARMLELRKVGYIFPDKVLERIDEEIKVRDNAR